MQKTSYPVKFSLDYPEGPRNRLTAFFRIFVAIPILIVLVLLMGATSSWGAKGWSLAMAGGGIVFLPTLLMILFRQKYPRWWFDWNLALMRFMTRVSVFIALLRDEYPSTDEEQAVHLDLVYPDAKGELNRWLPLVKWFLAIPHYIVLYCLYIAVVVVIIIGWFAILFTGKFPKDMYDFVIGVYRWYFRVMAYAILLLTDKYPPFSLD
ncbi:MAG TPA: DUF4389 domain-containing protein [Dehalococcoidia bacterium]|nr:DUF4389 domain-containing protein [Dehalococcoidia bacterium]